MDSHSSRISIHSHGRSSYNAPDVIELKIFYKDNGFGNDDTSQPYLLQDQYTPSSNNDLDTNALVFQHADGRVKYCQIGISSTDTKSYYIQEMKRVSH